MHFFDYALIRYMPDPKRGEIFNIGLIVFKPSAIDIRVLPHAHKIINSLNDNKLLSFQKSWEFLSSMVDEPNKRYDILASATHGVFLSEKAYFSIMAIHEYEPKVQELFNQLVKPVSAKRNVHHQNSRFYTNIKNQFKDLHILATTPHEIESHKVVPHYLLNEEMGLSADFALKNGHLRLTQTVDYNVHNPKEKQKETGLKIMSFLEGKKVRDNAVFYFVYSANTQKEQEIRNQLNMVSEYTDQLFNFESNEDKVRYFNMMANFASQTTDATPNLSVVNH